MLTFVGMEMPGLQKAIEICGSAAELARRIGVTPQAIYQWKEVPILRVQKIVEATDGRVTRGELRPDIWNEAA